MAYYVGTVGRADTMTALMSWLVARHGIEPLLKAPDGVEVTAREAHGQVYLFVLNHTHAERRVTLPGPCTDLLTDARRRRSPWPPTRWPSWFARARARCWLACFPH